MPCVANSFSKNVRTLVVRPSVKKYTSPALPLQHKQSELVCVCVYVRVVRACVVPLSCKHQAFTQITHVTT